MAVISMLHFAACSSGGDSGGGGSPPPPTAATSWNFEAGTFPPDPNVEPNAIPTVINLEGAPHLHYARLTASPSDCGEAFFTTCPRTRAEKYIGGFPLPDTTGQIVTFQFDIRIPSVNNSSAADNLIWQLFQNDASTSVGRSIWLGIVNGRVYAANRIAPVPNTALTQPATFSSISNLPAQVIDLGPVVYDVWHTYKLVVLLATDTTGAFSVYKDGVYIDTASNQPTLLSSVAGTFSINIDVVETNGTLATSDHDNESWNVGGTIGDPVNTAK